jgi:hypothetical protein
MYANQLRRLMATLEPDEQIPSNELMSLYTPPAGGFIRREDTGQTLYTNGQPGGIFDQPTDFTTPDDGGGMPPMQPMRQQQGSVMRVVGVGNGQVTELSPERGDVQPDFSRPMIDIPGVGKGYYAKDGRSAIVAGPNGMKTKVLLGYDAQGSAALNKADAERRFREAQIAHTQEQIDASREARTAREGLPGAGIPQSVLEKQYGKAPEGKRWNVSGQLEDIPGGSGKPLTEFQGKSTGYGTRAAEAHEILNAVGDDGKVQPGLIKRSVEAVPMIGDALGTIFHGTQSTPQMQVEQAQRNFINAVLRQESGAVISPAEFDNAKKQYFPQPNDPPELVAQKRANRETVIRSFAESAGPQGGGKVLEAWERARKPKDVKSFNGGAIPQQAIEYLTANPSARMDFDRKYGPGAAARVLGG